LRAAWRLPCPSGLLSGTGAKKMSDAAEESAEEERDRRAQADGEGT